MGKKRLNRAERKEAERLQRVPRPKNVRTLYPPKPTKEQTDK